MIIENIVEYEIAMDKLLDIFYECNDPEPDSPEGKRLIELAEAIEIYENKS